ncbi:MAG: hypothetical protein N3D10_01335 [Candidatus Micrarchaeota archaeon]|nr:hypothetical protein [Candidatus Micrarchaeota archaeon]
MLSNFGLSKLEEFKNFIDQELKKVIRVIKVSTKPSTKDFNFLLKLSVGGIFLLGLFGLIVSFLFSLLDLI